MNGSSFANFKLDMKGYKLMLESVDDLFLDFLKDIYFAEKKILRTMPKLVKGAASLSLRKR